jgi:hypothetical protein
MSPADRQFIFSLLGALSFSCLIVLCRTSNTVLNTRAECGYTVLVLIVKGKLTVFYHWGWCWLWVSRQASLCWGSFLLLICWVFLSWKLVEFCQKAFFCISWDGCVIFLLHSLDILHWFSHVEPSLCSRNKCYYLVMMCIFLLMSCWIWLLVFGFLRHY